ncbi:hypothetical protein AK830_g8030 [Neonectria ditissima]|uniref:Mitochondrial basic amino acids transporter n=1 Tax=Neonectria ditissima TaxID=78410 RepID=A0A0P7AYF6_9HYPO|nr:hypothetical protein AK830_g8030 [Neonectria ditissima]
MPPSLFATPAGNSFASVSATDESRSASGDGFAEYRAVGPAPTPLKLALAEHRTAVLTTAISGHFAHYQYLSRFRHIKLEAPGNRRTLATEDRVGSRARDMSADFWAGYVSGAVGILIGNPLDVIKVRLQSQSASTASSASSIAAAVTAGATPSTYSRYFGNSAGLVAGTAAPIIGYGALNALLFVSYNRTEAALNKTFSVRESLWSTWLAGAVGGLATWVVSTPTELIKCRAQLSSQHLSSWAITKQTWQIEGVRGLYLGGAVTAIRDSVGYGFYFWSYELSSRWLAADPGKETSLRDEAAKVLLCGGLAGVITWASIFPLDVVKTRVQAQAYGHRLETSPLLEPGVSQPQKRLGALHVARNAYRKGGSHVFFRGLAVCSVRAFIVNAVQWAVYEWVMQELGHGRKQRAESDVVGAGI